jgi:hypothetical protein
MITISYLQQKYQMAYSEKGFKLSIDAHSRNTQCMITCYEIASLSFKLDQLVIIFQEKEKTMLNWTLWWQG